MARIWVVDDEEPVRELLAAVLQESGHEVRLFADAREALAAFRPRVADACLLDVRLPGMDGLALLRELRRRDQDVAVLLGTGFPSIDDAVSAIQAGASDYIFKPFRVQDLRVRVVRALEVRDTAVRLRRNRRLCWLLIGSLPFWFVFGFLLATWCRGG